MTVLMRRGKSGRSRHTARCHVMMEAEVKMTHVNQAIAPASSCQQRDKVSKDPL